MGRAPCCDKDNVKRGPWSPEEDSALKNYVERHGTGGNWIALPQKAGLKRCGKSCRLRWLNYLRPDIKHGGFTEEEDNIIVTLYKNIGSRWSVIASQLPGRTDNDVKNYWNTKLKKKLFTGQTTTTTTSSAIARSTVHGNSAAATLPPPPAVPTAENSKTYCYTNFSIHLDGGFGTTPATPNPETLLPEIPPFPATGFVEPPANQGDGNYGVSMSPPQDISAASSSLSTMDSTCGYMPWSGDGSDGGGDDGFMTDFGFEPSSDFFNISNIANLWANAESMPPQGIYQSVTY